MTFLHPSTPDLQQLAKDKKQVYREAEPFPHVVIHDFFNEETLAQVLAEFPDLSAGGDVIRFKNQNEMKFGARGESMFGEHTRQFVHFLNSEPMLRFLQALTGVEETLLPDPYFEGGGYHEIKPGGFLKIHADFNKHRLTGLDRRLNLIVYLNTAWQENYGGHLELWNRAMTQAVRKITPTFNTLIVFSTNDFSYHGHPEPLRCPPAQSRKSLALYYYSNGRPDSEINAGLENHSTLFVSRPGLPGDVDHSQPGLLRRIVRRIMP